MRLTDLSLRMWHSNASRQFRKYALKGRFKDAIKHLHLGLQRFLDTKLWNENKHSADQARAIRHLQHGRSLLESWRLKEALNQFDLSIEAYWRDGRAHRARSLVSEYMGEMAAARSSARDALNADPINRETYALLQKHGMHAEVEKGIASIPSHLEEWGWQKNAIISAQLSLFQTNKIEQAMALLDTAEARDAFADPVDLDILRAETLKRMRSFSAAQIIFHSHLMSPRHRKQALQGISECCFGLGDFSSAMELTLEAATIQQSNEPRGFNNIVYHCLFLRNDCREAFRESRYRPFTQAIVLDVKGNYQQSMEVLKSHPTVGVIADYGIGDEIRFASVYPDLVAQLNNVSITCDPRLKTLLHRSFPQIEFLPVSRWREEALVRDPHSREGIGSRGLSPQLDTNAKVHMEKSSAFTSIFDILAELRPNHAAFGKKRSYLVPDPERIIVWKNLIHHRNPDGRPNIALSWRSMLSGAARDINYLKASDLKPLAALNAVFWIVQPNLEQNELKVLRKFLPRVEVIPELDLVDDFEGQTSFLTQMDCVVAPFNTTAELAGSLGVPVFMFGRVHAARCRLYPDGNDIWHPSVKGVIAPAVDNPGDVSSLLAQMLFDEFKNKPLTTLLRSS
ncbi:hypothetical protein [uncultured Aliiroseovarius sp.]|uniref:hypothetical protein n=1 Tax=uncultured Aliiroseovarius sp. TaxID=1658783 RepID=UPI002598E650|nr:hypothetical protein [uncultured Aliiroseovarius sp.]